MIRPASGLLALLAASCLSAEDGAGLYDLLGGADWSERHGEIIFGWTSLDVDGLDRDQDALYLSGAAGAISGYKSKGQPFGTILGLGAGLKTWWGNDQVDVRCIAPFAYGIAGVFNEFNDTSRADLTARIGPGLAYTTIDDDSEIGFAWTWAAEAVLTVTRGESGRFGIGLGYESVRVEDFTQEGPYLMLRIGF